MSTIDMSEIHKSLGLDKIKWKPRPKGMKLYSLSHYKLVGGDAEPSQSIGLFFSLEKAKKCISFANWVQAPNGVWFGHSSDFHVIITEVETMDEPDFATLAGEAFYATSE